MTNKIKNMLIYTGLAGAIMGAVGYILIVVAIVLGFETNLSGQQQLLIAIVGAADGVLINISLMYQGIAFAKREDKSQNVLKRYRKLISDNKTKKKAHSIAYYLVLAIFKNVIFKGATVALTTYFIVFIFMNGNGDYALFLVALANLCLFAGFGMMELAGMYDNYIEKHIPYLEGVCNKLDQAGSVPLEE